MSGIIELWRRESGDGLPTRFTVGNPPMLPSGTAMPDAPIIRSIDFRETGAAFGKRMSGPVFCVSFEDSFVQRFVPEAEVIDVAWETKMADATKTPALEV
jgi:hypothetical protein